MTLISQNGEKLKVNHLQLAIFNRLLLNENFEDEPAVITTNLGKLNNTKKNTPDREAFQTANLIFNEKELIAFSTFRKLIIVQYNSFSHLFFKLFPYHS